MGAAASDRGAVISLSKRSLTDFACAGSRMVGPLNIFRTWVNLLILPVAKYSQNCLFCKHTRQTDFHGSYEDGVSVLAEDDALGEE